MINGANNCFSSLSFLNYDPKLGPLSGWKPNIRAESDPLHTYTSNMPYKLAVDYTNRWSSSTQLCVRSSSLCARGLPAIHQRKNVLTSKYAFHQLCANCTSDSDWLTLSLLCLLLGTLGLLITKITKVKDDSSPQPTKWDKRHSQAACTVCIGLFTQWTSNNFL